MSGPKVVRIVTREEIIAICEGHLRRLDQAVSRWEAQAEQLGQLNEQERAATRARQARLRALVTEDQLRELQKAVPIEIEHLRRDQLAREERAVLQATEQRQHQRRMQENAALLLKALVSRTDTAPQVVQALKQLAEGAQADNAEQLLAQGFAQLNSSNEAQTLDEQQRALALRLKDDVPTPDLNTWLAERAQATRDPRLQQIDRHIAELHLLQGAACAAPFVQALARAEAQPQSQQRNLLLDSLMIELANNSRDFQLNRDSLSKLHDLANEVRTHLDTGSEALLEQISQCTASTSQAIVSELQIRCETILAAHVQAQAALARREAMLHGLAELGYEVREGMTTAWADSGKIVLRKSATPGYGVELGGKAENGRIQVRAVALSRDHDTQRDKDIETIWCTEFGRLQAMLQGNGSELLIERATGVGETPLKEALATEDEDMAAAAQLRKK
ncbi:hypothetical protein PZ739_12270 [Pseudomonas kermanshahensis]|uniref:hypothetical protein n=1 Tax=Pseudomonas kermanshahensis TaxID=2745482 RepID=UPI0023DC318E|nr:hypothetical protein [Pseudomonas kermanshahensis]WEL57886.1 hypothetical protein PZ739_12270 [Pseudomonas kermanshahensis]